MEKELLGATRPGPRPHNQMPGSLELAFLGDTIYDLYVRTRLVDAGGHVKAFNERASKTVCAGAQARALSRIEGMLTDAEAAVVRRARNARQTPTGHASLADYHRATALEALCGYLYLTGDIVRLDELMDAALADAPNAADEGEKHGVL